jgi:hypothetical protein
MDYMVVEMLVRFSYSLLFVYQSCPFLQFVPVYAQSSKLQR